MTRFAVIDVETTGLGNRDRIVEVAVVVVDSHGSVLDEYDTLIDPQRDVGPTHIHGISASMVSAAPLFGEVARSLIDRLEGAILVAHNLAFDTRMLVNEYERLGVSMMPGQGACTLRTTGERLETACARYGLPLSDHHRALADARVTAQLFSRLRDIPTDGRGAAFSDLRLSLNPRTLRREGTPKGPTTALNRLVTATRFPTTSGPELSYLHALDWAMDDLVITTVEQDHLLEKRKEPGSGGFP